MIDPKELFMAKDKHVRGIPKVKLAKPLTVSLLSKRQRVMLSRTIETSTRALHQGDLDVAIECFASGVCELAK